MKDEAGSLNRNTSPYLIRAYKSGDEVEAAQLFNEAFVKYAGFVPRTPEYWLWCYRKRPSVRNDGICIAEKINSIVGYAVVALELVGGKTQANVLDLCYRREESPALLRNLVNWVNGYAEKLKADAISLDAPVDDDLLRATVKELGFAESQHVIPLLMINDFAALINRIATSRTLPSSQRQVFHVRLEDVTTTPDNIITIETENGKIKAKLGEVGTATTKVITTVDTLTSCLFGNLNPTPAIFRRKIKVHPFWKLTQVAELLSTIQLNDPWFIPAGDFG